jgi:hypothetical protein
MFVNCPACLDRQSAVRCGLPAEVRCRFTMRSTGGPLESVMIRCPAGHYFNGPIEFLTGDSTDKQDPGTAGLGSHAGHDSGFALRASPGEPERKARRANTAPAYYLGRPAGQWVTVMRPRRRPASPRMTLPSPGQSAGATPVGPPPPARKMASEGLAMTLSGVATSSRDLPSASTARNTATRPPAIIAPAPMR